MLSTEDKQELLRIAREAIACALHERAVLPPETRNDALLVPSGAFVTLRIGHALRGCIGYVESTLPLAVVVAEVAQKAAFEDPRFPPLTPIEFSKMRLEISVLSPLERVTDVESIQVGVHGLLLESGSHRGLLLPQVPLEFGWDREEFLNATARKAGLPQEGWRDPQAALFAFTADVIEEHQIGEEAPS
jgi:AmmeMemoRadiSam system protein A